MGCAWSVPVSSKENNRAKTSGGEGKRIIGGGFQNRFWEGVLWHVFPSPEFSTPLCFVLFIISSSLLFSLSPVLPFLVVFVFPFFFGQKARIFSILWVSLMVFHRNKKEKSQNKHGILVQDHPRGTTLREALRGHLPLRGFCGGLSGGSAGLCGVFPRVLRGSAGVRAPRDFPRFFGGSDPSSL